MKHHITIDNPHGDPEIRTTMANGFTLAQLQELITNKDLYYAEYENLEEIATVGTNPKKFNKLIGNLRVNSGESIGEYNQTYSTFENNQVAGDTENTVDLSTIFVNPADQDYRIKADSEYTCHNDIKKSRGGEKMGSDNICKFALPNITTGITISDFILESNSKTMQDKVKLNSNRITLVTSGKCLLHFGKEEIQATKGDVAFSFKGEEIFATPLEEKTSFMYINFDGMRANEIFYRFGIDSENRLFKNHHGIIPLWKESLYDANGVTIDLAAESILLYTFSRFYSEAIKQESLVGKIIKYTKNHFANPNLSITILAKELSYNEKYISHTFKESMGIGYNEYLRNMRIKFALSLFDNGIESVKNAALLSGFTDPLYFSTVFKKHIGMSPKDYLRQVNR